MSLKAWATLLEEEVNFHNEIVIELHAIRRLLQSILGKEEKTLTDLAALTAQVKANTEVETSAITLIKGLADQIAAISTDPEAVAALASQLKSSADALAAAITANTPAAD